MEQQLNSANEKIETLGATNCCLKEEITQLQVRSEIRLLNGFESCSPKFPILQVSLKSSEESIEKITASGERTLRELRVSLAAREREVGQLKD